MSIWKPISELAADVQNGHVTPTELVQRSLKCIEEKQEYQAIIAVTAERALQRAKHLEARLAKGEQLGKLAGVPFIAKDNFLVFGAETTAASNILKGFDAPYQSSAIERLEAEGAICVAKANLDAFAHGSSTENSDYMTTRNPHDIQRVPGGSSGGSAAAVVLDLAPFALGTDTGGSIRQPASLSGAVGYKPTYGLVSRSGVVAMASSTDVIGPLTHTVEDAALVLECMAGKDALDGTTIDRDSVAYTKFDDITPKTLRIGVIEQHLSDGVQPGVRKQIDRAIEQLKVAGVQVETVSIPSIDLALACYYVLCPAEVSSNLSRYDGQRYGFAEPAQDLEQSYLSSRSIGFGDEAKRRIMIGTYVLSSGYYDAYYQKAQLVRTKLINEFSRAFQSYDILLGPTSPTTAFKIGEHTSDPLEMYLTDIMTVAVNLVGVPAINIPAGFDEHKLPVGIQLIAAQRQDRILLAAAQYIEGVIA